MTLGEQFGASATLERAMSVTFAAVEHLALLPIFVGESLTSASLVAAYSSMDALSSLFPSGEETTFSIASFINLMRNDWNNPELGEHLPEEHFSAGEAVRALFAWGALQSVTYDWQTTKWSKHLREIPRSAPIIDTHTHLPPIINVTEDVVLPGNEGQLLTADITPRASGSESLPASPNLPPPRPQTQDDLRLTLRRLSKMCLAGYGGASLLFFGVPPKPSLKRAKEKAKATLAKVVEKAKSSEKGPEDAQPRNFPWWSMLLGRHDHDIFLHYASGGKKGTDVTAVIGDEARMPRFWVLTDHSRQQIVLVFRGTVTLNEVAVDLSCEPEEFEPACGDDDDEEEDYVSDDEGYDEDEKDEEPEYSDKLGSMLPEDGQTLQVPTARRRLRSASFRSVKSFEGKHRYLVHGGMLKMSLAMGARGRPVFTAVKEALSRNQGYGKSCLYSHQ